MTYSISKDLKQVFGLAHLRHEATKMLTGKEWEEYQKIRKEFDGKRRYEQRQFKLEYKTRFETARKGLINRAAEKNKDFKHRWFGNDRFDKAAINRQAHRLVRNSHQNRMSKLDQSEAQATDTFLQSANHRRTKREKPKQDFARAADRRQKTERRSSKPQQTQTANSSSNHSPKQTPPPRGRSR